MTRRWWFAAFTLTMSACVTRVGQHAGNMESTYRASGSPALVFGAANTVDGELLEVRDSAYVILTPTEVVLVPLRVVDSARFVDRGKRVTRYKDLTPEQREVLRLISRYPPGMPDAATEQLLAARKQTAMRVFER